MDVEAYISQMEQQLTDARPVPLSASVMINRKDFEELVAGLRTALPDELRRARWVLKERDEVLAQASREAEQMLADARLERDRLVSETEVVRAASREADRIVSEARDHARDLRLEAEDYVDSKLANFEIILSRLMTAVGKGRERLRGRLPSDELAGDGGGAQPGDQPPRRVYDHESAGAEPPGG
ncbi:MAG TPA: hypothetical protein VG452_06405 [Egibacteraceae bacterium]|nr:hypothetical protein [Actinomycetota bacterium]HWB71830.1 hypothetical protein [Egibacteraceae bacterium]